jgi:hypothetical protein
VRRISPDSKDVLLRDGYSSSWTRHIFRQTVPRIDHRPVSNGEEVGIVTVPISIPRTIPREQAAVCGAELHPVNAEPLGEVGGAIQVKDADAVVVVEIGRPVLGPPPVAARWRAMSVVPRETGTLPPSAIEPFVKYTLW